MLTKAPKGTKDILPQEVYKWHYVESLIRQLCTQYGYHEIRTPVFEHTELFERGVGNTSDVVTKEMYTFEDKGGRSITLRPEVTAAAVRSYIENGMSALPSPTKLYYIASCYRYEKPQSGRLREFHQFGVECFGSMEPALDAEIISIGKETLDRLGVKNVELHINSIGCPVCRKKYNEKLIAYIESVKDKLCDTCMERYLKNPLRIFDCKSPICQEAMADAPLLFDDICQECADHFKSLKENLDAMGIKYQLDKKIVRGLDYYTKTVFEFLSNDLGAQSAVCAGGRYDGLVQELGGAPTPGIGFGLGLERLLLTLEKQGVEFAKAVGPKLFIAAIGEDAALYAQTLCYQLRKAGISCEKDLMGRSLKAQMKYANKLLAQYTVCLGDEEISKEKVMVKNMETGETQEIELKELSNFLKKEN